MPLKIPFWDEIQNKLEKFIKDRQLLKDLNSFANDKRLIHSALATNPSRTKLNKKDESMSNDKADELKNPRNFAI